MYLHLILIRIQLGQHGIQHKKIYLHSLGFTHSIRLWSVSTKHSEKLHIPSASQNVVSCIFPFSICTFILGPNVLYVLLHSGKYLLISLLTSSDLTVSNTVLWKQNSFKNYLLLFPGNEPPPLVLVILQFQWHFYVLSLFSLLNIFTLCACPCPCPCLSPLYLRIF